MKMIMISARPVLCPSTPLISNALQSSFTTFHWDLPAEGSPADVRKREIRLTKFHWPRNVSSANERNAA